VVVGPGGKELASFDPTTGERRATTRLQGVFAGGLEQLDRGPWLVSGEWSSQTAIAWNSETGALLEVVTDRAAFDRGRARLFALQIQEQPSKKGKAAWPKTHAVELEVHEIGKPVRRIPAGTTDDLGELRLAVQEMTGFVSVELHAGDKTTTRWFDPATGKPAKIPVQQAQPPAAHRPSDPVLDLPTDDADFFASLSFLKTAVAPGRSVLDAMAPGPNLGAGWIANGVRTRDAATVVAFDERDAARADEDDDPFGILVYDVATKSRRGWVPVVGSDGPWMTISIVGERYAAARHGWQLTIVDLATATLRASIPSFETGGIVTLHPGDLASAGAVLYDLASPRTKPTVNESRVDWGMAPMRGEAGRGALHFSEYRRPTSVVVGPGLVLQAAEGARHEWVRCTLGGEWILPLAACEHRVERKRLPK